VHGVLDWAYFVEIKRSLRVNDNLAMGRYSCSGKRGCAGCSTRSLGTLEHFLVMSRAGVYVWYGFCI
jgi:hypothetical protein